MNTIAHPTKRAQLLDMNTVLRHRSLFCAEYDECLETAAAAGWMSWSCEKCPLASLQTAPPAPTEQPAADLAMAGGPPSFGGDDAGAACLEVSDLEDGLFESDLDDGPLEIAASPQSPRPSAAEFEAVCKSWEGVYIG